MSPKKVQPKLLLTQRALRDLVEIEDHSAAEWGKRVASKYMADLQAGLSRIRKRPQLLRPEADLHPRLCFHRVNKHLLVCDVQPKATILLTVIHASRDIPSRLAEIEPTFAAEIELLQDKLR